MPSLRRIIRNHNAEKAKLTGFKRLVADTSGILRRHDSTTLLRKLREEEELMELMRKSAEQENPFSLLGKLEIYEYGNPKEILYTCKKPILIIPEQVNNPLVSLWEEKNTLYQKQKGLFRVKKITREEYLAQGADREVEEVDEEL